MTTLEHDFQPGNLIRARGREWVVQTDSHRDWLRLRPLGGAEDETIALIPELELAPVEHATFELPVPALAGNHAAAVLLVTATEVHEKALVASQSKARLATRTAQIEANKWPALLEELSRWDGAAGSAKAQADIDTARAHSLEIAQKLSSAQLRLAVAQQKKSDREKAVAALIDRLTQQVLLDGAFGSFDPRDAR